MVTSQDQKKPDRRASVRQLSDTLGVDLFRSASVWERAVSREEAEEQRAYAQRFLALLAEHDDCFDRRCVPGHFTGAALVVTSDLTRVLLTHHRKLDRWLQLGGHADGNPRLEEVALREAEEESGLSGLRFLPWEPHFGMSGPLFFDLDIHSIPARASEPEHQHYDARYLIVADHPEKIQISEESHDLRWFSLSDARQVAPEPGMLRLFAKLEWLASRLRGKIGA